MNTEIVKLNGTHDDLAIIRRAAKLVEDGELVVFPTETVYGIAARASVDAIAKLDEIKKRDSEKHYTLHVSSPSIIESYVPNVTPRTRRLIDNALPGPLTLVFDVDRDIEILEEKFSKDVLDIIYKNKSIGLRCPDNTVATTLLSLVDAEVVAPSANIGGQAPATDAQMAYEMLNTKVAMILDCGPCREKQSSSVVRVTSTGFDVIREGSIRSDELKSMSEVNIIFVCTGNTCRSPMAEAMFTHALAKKIGSTIDQLPDLGYIISSAGVMAAIDQPASQHSVDVCSEMGLDITGHKSRGLREREILESDIIYVMSNSHKERILSFYPEVASKCRLLLKNGDIPDPFGGDVDIYRKCASKMKEAINERLGELTL